MDSGPAAAPLFHPFRKPCLGMASQLVHEMRLVCRDQRAKRVLLLLGFNSVSILCLMMWSLSTNSLSLVVFSTLIWIDFLSLLTCLLGFWVEQKKPNKIFTFGHIRCEILSIFVITVVALLSSLLVIKECIVRLSDQPQVHTGRLIVGIIVCAVSHLVVKYLNDKGKAFAHVFSFSSSNIFQEQVAKFSRSLCQTVPGVSSLLLPRVNPLILFLWLGVAVLFIVHIFIEVYNSHFADTVLAFALSLILMATIAPLAGYTARILLQTIPPHMVGHLDKCLREASTLDGVLEFRNEHFWTLGFGNLVGSVHVRIRRDANEQLVLSHLTNRLSNLVSDLTIQVFKDEWAWNPSPRVLHKDHSVLLKYGQSGNNSLMSSSSASNLTLSTAPLTAVAVYPNKAENRNNAKSAKDDNWVQEV